ncbi:hypothetical protein [Bacillus cereus group sp. BfR-BA-01431]|nr:hypothetical protein [Bacillus cereus group sp. BfR-BA-01431]
MLALLYATNINKVILVSAMGIDAEDYLKSGDEFWSRITANVCKNKKIFPKNYIKPIKINMIFLNKCSHCLSILFFKSIKCQKINKALRKDIKLRYDVSSKRHILKDIPILVIQGVEDLITPK